MRAGILYYKKKYSLNGGAVARITFDKEMVIVKKKKKE